MLWAIRDCEDYYADVTIVRASSREEAVRLWMESDNGITLKRVDGGWLCKVASKEGFKPLDPKSNFFKKLTKYTMLDDHLIQVVLLEGEGESAMVLDRDYPDIPDKLENPDHQPEALSAEGLGLRRTCSPTNFTMRVVCSNTLSLGRSGSK